MLEVHDLQVAYGQARALWGVSFTLRERELLCVVGPNGAGKTTLINALAGVQFQKEMVEQFVQALGMFPTGSIVETNSGEVGIVVEQNRVRRLRPVVMLVLDAAKQRLAEHRVLDLRRCPSDQRASDACWIVRGHEPGAFGLDPKNYFVA